MGTALEIALAPADAFSFLQTEILDKVDAAGPFFGYVSIRVCRQTKTLMGMQQFGDPTRPYSVMIEIVAFGTPNSIAFLQDLQVRTMARIANGLDAMLHWGLENDRVTGDHLRKTMGLRRQSAHPDMSRLDTFKAVRGVVRAVSDAPFTAFDNAFTARMWLNTAVDDDDPWSFQTVQLGTRKTTKVGPRNRGHAPMRIVGVSVDGDFRMQASYESPSRPANLEVGPIPSAPVPINGIFELPLAFTATGAGTHTGTLTIVTYADAPDSVRVIRIALHANVDAIVLSVVDPVPPAPLDFGPVNVGQTKTVQVVVRSDSTWLPASSRSRAPIQPRGAGCRGHVRAGIPAARRDKGVLGLVHAERRGATVDDTDADVRRRQRVQSLYAGHHAAGHGIGNRGAGGLSPAALDFGTLTVNAKSAPQLITVRNVGQAPLLISGSITGSGFRLVGQMPASLLPGQEEQVALEFVPGVDGPVSDTFTIQSNSAQPPVPIALTGAGVLEALMTAKPASLGFGSVSVGSESPGTQVVVTNAGFIPIVLQGFALSGPDAADFRISANDRKAGGHAAPGADVHDDGRVQRQCCRPEGGDAGGRPRLAELTVPNPGRWPGRRPEGHRPAGHRGRLRRRPGRDELPATARDADEPVGLGGDHRLGHGYGQGPRQLRDQQGRLLGRAAPARGQVHASRRRCPDRLRPKEAELTVTADVPADAVPLRANGLDISVQWSTALLDFSTWDVGHTSDRKTVSIHNSGNTSVVISRIDVAGEFMVQTLREISLRSGRTPIGSSGSGSARRRASTRARLRSRR